jgi:ribosomal-protein-alanine N-acetyltransferase
LRSCILTTRIEVRPFELRDLDRILAIERASFGADAWNQKLLLGYFRECPALFFTAKIARHIAGYSITCISRRDAELVSIAVGERDRRRGVGQALLSETLTILRSRRIKNWRLMVDASSQTALRFYERYGFERTRIVKGYYGAGRDGLGMRMLL